MRAVYSQYANALFQCGQTEHAKEWYQKVLELDPEGTSLEARAAREQLEYLAKHAAKEAASSKTAPWITKKSQSGAPWLNKPKPQAKKTSPQAMTPGKAPAKPQAPAPAPAPVQAEKTTPQKAGGRTGGSP